MRLRLRYAKLGKVRFTSHRDTARVWERALRRSGVPVATSAGFTPRPRLSFGLALPTGAESIAEYLDVELREDGLAPDVSDLPARLEPALPAGFFVLAIAEEGSGVGSLQGSVTSVTWELESPAGIDLEKTVERVLGAGNLLVERERKGERRVDDVRPAIRSLAVRASGSRADGITLVAELATIGRGLRPAELAAVTFPGVEVRTLRALRTHQWIEHDGDRREVLPLPAPAPLVGA